MSVVVSGSKPKAVAINIRERTRGWLSAVNLHWAGVALLGLVNVWLLVQMGVAWQTANSQNADAIAAQRIALTSAQIAARPLEGLDVKLASASERADRFYLERLPVSYSEIASELGNLKKRTGVRLTRVQYSQAPVAGEMVSDRLGGQLTEVRMDASLTGDYRPLMLFINGLERDKVFYMISGVTLTGQQTGLVSLRIRVTTYLRGLVSDDEMQKAQNEAEAGSMSKDVDAQAASALSKTPAGGAR